MLQFILRRLALLPIALLLANFGGFAYAHFAVYLQQQRNPFYAPLERPGPLVSSYAVYVFKAAQGDVGTLPVGAGIPLSDALGQALAASTGLLLLAFLLSVVLGTALGLWAVRYDPPAVRGWLAPLSTVGLAMPSFFAGTLLVLLVVNIAIRLGPGAPPVAVSGFGWDTRLALPVAALVLRPTFQIAQATASLLAAELGRRYVVTARAIGNPWRAVRWRHALANALAPAVLNMASSFRLLMAELIVVEWLFGWPGIGRLFAWILIPSHDTSILESAYFLHPPALAGTLAGFALYFLLADLAASTAARLADPRLRQADLHAT